MSNDIRQITIQLRAPRGKDAGKIAIGHYCVVDSAVVLTDETGNPIGDEKHHLGPGGDARLIACTMLRKREKSSGSNANFNGPINYPKIGY